MTSPLASLYTELVMEHDKRPLHAGLREPFDTEVHLVTAGGVDVMDLRVEGLTQPGVQGALVVLDHELGEFGRRGCVGQQQGRSRDVGAGFHGLVVEEPRGQKIGGHQDPAVLTPSVTHRTAGLVLR